MRRFDCFLYDNEQEMLLVRLRALRGVFDAHVAVSANRSHQGAVNVGPPMFTTEMQEAAGEIVPGETTQIGDASFTDYDRYEGPRLLMYQVDVSGHDHRGRGGAGTADYQQRERSHRDGILAALEVLEPDDDDLVFVSDVDEIPRPSVAESIATDHRCRLQVLQMRMHCFALDWQFPAPWLGTTVFTWRDRIRTSPQIARDLRGNEHCPDRCVVPDAGWHLTWMGGPLRNERKQDRFSHAELNGRDRETFARHRLDGIDSNGVQLLRVDPEVIDHYDWPRGLVEAAELRPDYWRIA